MPDVVLVEPQIPTNTGNIIRLCANTGTRLHLVEPLGFSMEAARLRRAHLDYEEFASVRVHAEWAACRAALGGARVFGFSAEGRRRYDQVAYADDDVLVFGCEAAGLDRAVLREFAAADALLSLPMGAGSRSLNLANAVAVVVYEAWRQAGFDGAAAPGNAPRRGAFAESLGSPDSDV